MVKGQVFSNFSKQKKRDSNLTRPKLRRWRERSKRMIDWVSGQTWSVVVLVVGACY